MAQVHTHDVLIIGSGGAGLSLALRLPDSVQVAVIAKGQLKEGCTLYAQGGISAVTDPSDSFESHIEDTLDAGAGLNKPEVVRFTVENAPGCRLRATRNRKMTRPFISPGKVAIPHDGYCTRPMQPGAPWKPPCWMRQKNARISPCMPTTLPLI